MTYRYHGPDFMNDGGPLLVLPDALRAAWTGSPDEDALAGDYGRACANDDGESVAVLAVGEGLAVVVGTPNARWIVDDASAQFVLDGGITGEDGTDELLLRELPDLDEAGWTPLLDAWEIDGNLVLFHAACSGTEVDPLAARDKPWIAIGDASSVPVRPGRYVVAWRLVTLSDETRHVLCRWQPVT